MNLFSLPVSSLQLIMIVFSSSSVFFVLLLVLFKKIQTKKTKPIDKFEELYQKINKDLKHSVESKFIEVGVEANALVGLAIEVWRLEQKLSKMTSEFPENKIKMISVSLQKIHKYIEGYDMEIIDYTGQNFNEGLSLDVLSGKIDNDSIIQETVEPTIMYRGQVIRKAKIILSNK